MKKLLVLSLFVLSLGGPAAFNGLKAQPNISVDIDFNTFRNELNPYGRWVHNATYGDVWIYNEPGFRPYYTNGHWDYTDYGWAWVSDYDWGWAPFHYGRWEEDPYYGWMWIPGYEWAPAWVTWSQSDDYYGWAPLGFGIDVNISLGRIPSDRWVFMPRQYITSPRLRDYSLPFSRNTVIVRNTTIINNVYAGRSGNRYMRGPDRYDVERSTHARIQSRSIDNDSRYGLAQRNNRSNGFNNNRNDGNRGNDNRGFTNNDNRRNEPNRNDNNGRIDRQPDNRNAGIPQNNNRNFSDRNRTFNDNSNRNDQRPATPQQPDRNFGQRNDNNRQQPTEQPQDRRGFDGSQQRGGYDRQGGNQQQNRTMPQQQNDNANRRTFDRPENNNRGGQQGTTNQGGVRSSRRRG